jgi:glycerol-3-phosphate dehydrogenase subunit C
LIKGDRARAAKLAEKAVRLFGPAVREQAGPLLLLSPSCLWMVKESWPLLAPGRDADLIAERAAEAGGFVASRLGQGGRPALKPAKRLLAYQAPCHLRLIQSARPAFELASLVPGIELVDLGQGCCGLGGTYGMERANAGPAEAAAAKLKAALAERPYEGVVSECEACRMQLGRVSGLKALHPLELVAEAL